MLKLLEYLKEWIKVNIKLRPASSSSLKGAFQTKMLFKKNIANNAIAIDRNTSRMQIHVFVLDLDISQLKFCIKSSFKISHFHSVPFINGGNISSKVSEHIFLPIYL